MPLNYPPPSFSLPPHPNSQECVQILKKHGFKFECRFEKDNILKVTNGRYLGGTKMGYENGEWFPLRGSEVYAIRDESGEYLLYSRNITEEERHFEKEAKIPDLIRFRKEKIARLIA